MEVIGKCLRRPNACLLPLWRRQSTTSSPQRSPKQQRRQICLLGQTYDTDHTHNISRPVLDKLGRNLHSEMSHPVWLVKKRILRFFSQQPEFASSDDLNPVIPASDNFASADASYFINQDVALRGHMLSHEKQVAQSGVGACVLFGDVYRRCPINPYSYPVFHQCGGMKRFPLAPNDSAAAAAEVEHAMKVTLERLVDYLFDSTVRHEKKWVASTDLTGPVSPNMDWKMLVEDASGSWVEVISCNTGVESADGVQSEAYWQFGVGMDRLAMLLFQVPDIRMFWCRDKKFLNQFSLKEDNFSDSVTFTPFSRFQPITRDLQFSRPAGASLDFNAFSDVVRDSAGDFVEKVELSEREIDPEEGHKFTFRVTFRHFLDVIKEETLESMIASIKHNAGQQFNAKF